MSSGDIKLGSPKAGQCGPSAGRDVGEWSAASSSGAQADGAGGPQTQPAHGPPTPGLAALGETKNHQHLKSGRGTKFWNASFSWKKTQALPTLGPLSKAALLAAAELQWPRWPVSPSILFACWAWAAAHHRTCSTSAPRRVHRKDSVPLGTQVTGRSLPGLQRGMSPLSARCACMRVRGSGDPSQVSR